MMTTAAAPPSQTSPLNPPNPQAVGALVALVNEDRLSEAEHKVRALLTVHPSAGMLWKILSVALVRQGKDALPALRRTAELMPNDAEAHRNLGAALHDQGQWAPALESLRRALALAPHDVDALVDAADAMRGLGRPGDAVALYQHAVKHDPRLIEAQNNLGNAFLELSKFEDAARCYRLALGIRPDDPQILCNLGNVLRQQGLIDEAITTSERAIALDPRLSVAHNTLGLAFTARGRLDEAVAHYRQALTLDARYVDALNNLGNVLRDRGERREAASLYRQGIELDPRRAESHCSLGTVLFELRLVDEAAASFRQALALRPDYAPAHLSLGLALRQQRRPAEAEVSCQAALAIDPIYVDALAFLGELRADRGQFAEAEELFQRAITIRPDFAPARVSIATHRKMTSDDGEWLTGAHALLAKRLSLADEISLRYALGKYFDDVRQYDSAFSHYRQANELTKRYGASYDRAKLTERVDRIIRSCDAEWIRETREHASMSELPVLIVGMPRSGTSLTEQILASHPAVYGAGEVIFWNAAYDAYRDAERDGRAGAELMAGMARDYVDRLTSFSTGAQRVVDKMPANFLYAGFIHAALPQARIIHMQRHPFDTCLSIYFQNFFNIDSYANDLDDLAHFYGQYLRTMNYWRTVLPESTLLEIPYEALVGEPEVQVRQMLAFVGLPWDPHCLNFHQTDRVVITASKWQVRQKITKGSVGRWRNYESHIGPLRGLPG